MLKMTKIINLKNEFQGNFNKTTNFLNEIPQKNYLLLFLDNIAFTKAKNIQCEFLYYFLCIKF